jgi:hypothetical protein
MSGTSVQSCRRWDTLKAAVRMMARHVQSSDVPSNACGDESGVFSATEAIAKAAILGMAPRRRKAQRYPRGVRAAAKVPATFYPKLGLSEPEYYRHAS